MRFREGALAGGEFVQHDAEGPDVRTAIGWFAAELLRSHVRQGAGDLLRTGKACGDSQIAFGVDELCQSEIEDLETPVGGQAKIGWFQVAMDDALRVSGAQPLRKLQTQAHHFLRAQRARRQLLVQRVACDVLRDQEVGFVGGIEIVDGSDVGMVELGQGESFLAKSLAGSFVGQGAGGQDLYGNLAFQLLVMRKKYDSHPSRADLFLDAVATEIFPEQVPGHTGMLSPSGKRVK